VSSWLTNLFYTATADYGVGIDRPSGLTRNVGVLGTQTLIPNAGGAIVDFSLSEISSDEELQTSLGVSASASGGVGRFSASASLDFSKKCQVHSNSVFLLVSVQVNLAFAQIREPKIDPDAAAKLVDGNATRFQEMYGDSFVRGIQTGGRFFAVVEVFTTTKSEKDSLSVSLQGSYGMFSGKAGFSSGFSDALSNKTLKITCHHEGGVVPKDPTSLEEVQDVAARFAASVEGHAVPYAVLLSKYTILDLPNPPNFIDLQNQMDVLAFCARQRNSIWTAINNVNYIYDHLDQFATAAGEYDMTVLDAYRTALESDLESVSKAASHALDHAKDAALPLLTAKPPELPKRHDGEADVLAAKGAAIAEQDPLSIELRNRQQVGAQRRGFDIGMAAAEGDTLPGPGKKSIHDSLDPAGGSGFDSAVEFSLERNRNAGFAAKGAGLVKVDPILAAARAANTSVMYWLGFDIGAGLFGEPSLGGAGNTSEGPGSRAVRDGLCFDGQAGFRAATDLYLVQKHKAAAAVGAR
jgi:hypothetical protein